MVTIKGKKYTTLDDLHSKWIKNRAYKKAYEDLELEFSIISAINLNIIIGLG